MPTKTTLTTGNLDMADHCARDGARHNAAGRTALKAGGSLLRAENEFRLARLCFVEAAVFARREYDERQVRHNAAVSGPAPATVSADLLAAAPSIFGGLVGSGLLAVAPATLGGAK